MKMLMRVINKRYDMDNAVRKGTQVNESLIYVNTTVCMLHSLPQQGVATNTLYTVENHGKIYEWKMSNGKAS